jgi:phage terminase large subunit GpA-like protein
MNANPIKETKTGVELQQKFVPTYSCLADIFIELADQFRPPERLKVSEAAEKYVWLSNPGSYVGPYQNDQAPYMVEPMDEFASKWFEGLIFVGPAQCGKTQSLLLNAMAYNILVDPLDMMMYHPTRDGARDFSVRRIDRMHRVCKSMKGVMLPDRDADNKFEKKYRSGMILTLGWPTVSQFAGKPIPRVMLTDFDRMEDNIEGDGNPYDLASKRTTTFGTFAMTVAESSPSRPLTSNRWIRASAHEAPPTTGILALYNRGDRRRYYWACPECAVYFEGNFKMLTWTPMTSAMRSGETVKLVCPSCSAQITPDQRAELYRTGKWLKDGEAIIDGEIVGETRASRIASFWLNGVAASFITWPRLVEKYLDAENEYKKTGSEDALRKFYNTDLGEPYLQKQTEIERLPEVLKSRAQKLPECEVPDDVRFLIATIDVQTNQFVVQVFGIQPGIPFDMVVIDRFEVRKSNRVDADGERLWVKPHTYVEDWELLIESVILKTYPLCDGSGRRMHIKATGCDSGGREGVTTKAYDFWRVIAKEGHAARFHLLKGEGFRNAPRARVSYPDSNRRDEKAAARGDVPVLMLNSNLLKDDLLGRLDCNEPGKGMFRFPDWLPDAFFTEMCMEVRETDGWVPGRRKRNEAWDLAYYCVGLCVSVYISVERINWANPPGWAAPWDKNDLVFSQKTGERFAFQPEVAYDLSALAKQLA